MIWLVLNLALQVMEKALLCAGNAYYLPNATLEGYLCKTNLPSNTAFRGFGGPQAMFITETWMSQIALKCELTQEQVSILSKAVFSYRVIYSRTWKLSA